MLLSCLKCFQPYSSRKKDELYPFDEYDYSTSYLIINGFQDKKIPIPSQPAHFLLLLRKINTELINELTFEIISDNILDANNTYFKRYLIKIKNNTYDIYNLILSFSIQQHDDTNISLYIRCVEGHIHMRTLNYWIKIKDIFTKIGYSVVFQSRRF